MKRRKELCNEGHGGSLWQVRFSMGHSAGLKCMMVKVDLVVRITVMESNGVNSAQDITVFIVAGYGDELKLNYDY